MLLEQCGANRIVRLILTSTQPLVPPSPKFGGGLGFLCFSSFSLCAFVNHNSGCRFCFGQFHFSPSAASSVSCSEHRVQHRTEVPNRKVRRIPPKRTPIQLTPAWRKLPTGSRRDL